MATVTVSASTTLALLTYAAGDDIVITGATTLTVDADPSALPAIRSIRSTDPRSKLYIRNTATAFSAGNLWKVPFENGGSVVGTGGTLAFTGGATCEIEGEMLECYTATGTASETVLDASNVLGVDIDFPYHIEAETAAGSGIYKPVPVVVIGGVGNGFIATSLQNRFGTGDVGRVLFYDHTTRLLKTGDGTNGTLFASGVKFRIPNVLMWLPPFTLTVGAGGWTAATGSQPVNSSTNAPVNSAGQFVYTIGSEIVSVTALPTGTSVTVNNRALDGTSATTYSAGALAYCIPNRNVNMAGKILTATGGNYILKKCFFSRWWSPYFSAFGSIAADRVGLISPSTGVECASTSGQFSYTNGVMICSPALCRQAVLTVNQVTGNYDISGTSFLGTVGTVGVNGYASIALVTLTTVPNISDMTDVRTWRMGCPTGVAFSGAGLSLTASSFAAEGINGLELVNTQLVVSDTTMRSMSRLRYSSTNGTANTTTSDAAFSLGPTGKVADVIVYDFDVLSGGLAPYDLWFVVTANAKDLIIHNKVGGVIKSVDCQSRTRRIADTFSGVGHVFANATFTNVRASSLTQINSLSGSSITIKNVRWSDLAGAVQDSSSVQPVRAAVFDFPGGPVNPSVINQADVQAVYACPNTWPGLAGGLYVGPVTAKQQLDLYELTAGAYQNNAGSVFIETSGDAIVIKATSPVTGISSVTGTSPVFYGVSPSTGLTYEFRLCNWGDDITALSWTALTGGNVQSAFNALSGYTIYRGLNFQLKITATTTSASRQFQQCWIPVQMDTAYNPPTGEVDINIVGAAVGATAVLYDGSDVLKDTATIDAGGEATMRAPYDFDGVGVTGTLKIREIDHQSIDTPITWVGEATVPAAMTALSGYVPGPYAGASFNKATKVVTVSSAMTTQDLWSAWREYIVQFVNFDTDDDWTYAPLNAGTWEVAFSGAGSISGSYTDRNGTRAPITAPNLPVGTRVQFYNDTDNVELTNEVLAGAGASTSLYFTSAKTIRLRASKLGSLPIEAFGVMTASGLTFIDEFVDDDVYIAKAIDGSTVTEFTADEPNVQIDSDDPDGVSSVWRCYAWFRYYETSSLGIAGNLFGAANAIDTENLAIDSTRANIQLDNVSAVPLKINDGYMYRTDGATIISPTSGSIQMDPKKAYSATGGGGGGATAEEIWTHPSRTLVPVGGVTNLY